jgi:23S rRNA pseudouridine1911/1915/1917 synthase
MAVVRNGREAATRYDLSEAFGDDDCALLLLSPKTGRTHQLRVHLKWLGHPVVGDKIYGRSRKIANCHRLFLHATTLEVISPSTGNELHFEAPLAPELEMVLGELRRAPS